ncbi:hypothetical protein BWQ93_01630 [Sphingopyxis sp. QXT-31]|uniref:hypothetical protein n=1 Tax=Sphingopyxis sp. QXT-31 TaxID=1357916 RepID=UPI0009795545|nr:hypothetical protein [Sphingopyxis sp. QXT-31]APZ97334.1 hypothetical protein BWQ93_01630 [Sphingopyxis sp. QXT-31]
MSAAAAKPHTAFSIHAVAYKIARQAFEQHRAICLPDDDAPLMHDYESACAPLIEALLNTARKAIQTPAASVGEVWQKLTIFAAEDMQDLVDAKDVIAHITADALRLAGAE